RPTSSTGRAPPSGTRPRTGCTRRRRFSHCCSAPVDFRLGRPQNPLTNTEGGCAMSWNLSGRYVETCSCDLMCPCNISFDHGATYDYCRATLCFDIEQGEIEGTDVG